MEEKKQEAISKVKRLIKDYYVLDKYAGEKNKQKEEVMSNMLISLPQIKKVAELTGSEELKNEIFKLELIAIQ